MSGPTIPDIVTEIQRDALYWAPELRVNKLLAYLDAYGAPLYEALMALPAEDREVCGVDKIRRVSR